MSTTIENINCPNCGAQLINLPVDGIVICQYCGSALKLSDSTPVNIHYTTSGVSLSINSDAVLRRVDRLLYLGEYDEAQKVIRAALLSSPDNRKMLEYENVCNCFLTRIFENYLKMLGSCSFMLNGLQGRYVTEINGYCDLLGNNANNKLNFPIYRQQNLQNYNALLHNLELLKVCLRNNAVIDSQIVFNTVAIAILKLSAIACNTVYVLKRGNKNQVIVPIDMDKRRALERDFDIVWHDFNADSFAIVSEAELKKHLAR